MYNNLSKEEREALVDLGKDNKVVVRPADEGGAIVLQNIVDYNHEIERQLGDSTCYEKLSSDPTKRLLMLVHSKLVHHFEKE